MSVETRSQTVAEEATKGAGPNNGAESDRAHAAASSLPAAPKPELGNLQGETFVIEKTDTRVAIATTQPPEPAPTKASIALFDQNMAENFRSRWNEIQVAFVDEPRDAVGRADELVAETIKELSGIAAPTTLPRPFAWRSRAIAPSSIDCCLSRL